MRNFLLGTMMMVLAAGAMQVTEEPSGYDLWGMRPKHVAIVNPVLGEDPAAVLSLAGEWEFCTRKFVPERNASWGVRFAHQNDWPNTRKIRVPGNVEAQGVGEPGKTRPWDCFWDCSPKPMSHVFYGAAWYRRTVEIPAAWKDRRIWFKVGEVTSQGWLWVNDVPVAWLESYCGCYKYDITDLVKPGEKAKIVLQVSNEVAKRCGAANSDHLWLGVMRDLELEATPRDCWIDEAWVRGDFDKKVAEVNVDVGLGDEVEKKGEGGQRCVDFVLRATVDGVTKEEKFHCPPPPTFSTLTIPLPRFRPWSPEHPNLYTAKVDLVVNGQVVQTRRERFGVRKFEVRGKDFYLNGKPFFVRGIGYHNVQPVYGPSRVADRDYRRFEMKRLRDAGFNFVRTHTRCDTPEFFEACDELGMMVQPEMPYYTDQPCEKFEFNPVRDAKELYIHRRRHPSFAIYSHGNEGSFGAPLGNYLYKMIKQMDPDRLVIEQDCSNMSGPIYNPKERADYCGGPINEWPRGTLTFDRPMVVHEYLNLSVKANADLEDRYTGAWQPPFGKAKRAAFLAKFGLTDFWGRRLQLAQHALQAYWLKHGLEVARTDPACDGYFYWSAQDCTTPTESCGITTYSAQGLFDPFWGDKPNGSTAASVAVYNSPCGVFCDTDPESRIVVSGDAVKNVIWFANYGDAALPPSKIAWRLVAKNGGKVLAQGEGQSLELPLGGVRRVGGISFNAPQVDAAAAATLEVSLSGAKNAWGFWIFPKRSVKPAVGVCIVEPLLAKLGARYTGLVPPAEIAKAKVVVAPADSAEAKAAVQRGQNVISIGKADGAPDVRLGWWWLGDQVGTAFADDPVYRYLPQSGVLDPLFFRIFKKGVKLPLAGVKEQDLLAVCEGGYGCRCNLAVRRHGAAREYLVYGLDVCADLPEAKALLDGLIEAMSALGAFGSADLEITSASSMEKVLPRDGAKRAEIGELRVRLARGETEAVQLFVRDAARDRKGVRVRLTDLLRVREGFWDWFWLRTAFPLTAVKVSVLGYVETTNVPPYKVVSNAPDAVAAPALERKAQPPAKGWWPDPILDYLETVDVKAGDRQGFWLSFRAPRDQAAGVYEGEVVVEADGAVVRTIPLTVRVNDFTLPVKTPLPTAITFAPGPNTQWEKEPILSRAKRLRADPEAPCNCWKKHAIEWADFMADRYVTMDNLYHRDLLAEPMRVPALRRLADQGRLDCFNIGYWDYPKTLSDADKQKWREATMARLKKSYDAVKAAGIEKCAYLYGCDEIDKKYFDCIRWAVGELKAAFPGVKISTTAYDHDYGIGTPLAEMDWFTPLTEKFDPAKAAKARSQGRQVWWYICCCPHAPFANMFVECPAIEGRILMGAQTAKYRPDGFLYYQTTLWNAERPISGPSAFTSWSARSWTNYHGDGSWLCAGPDGTPLSTIRFENLRDGLEDFAYVKILEERLAANPDAPWAAKARELLAVPKTLVVDKTHFTNDPFAVYAWRDAMADLIETAE